MGFWNMVWIVQALLTCLRSVNGYVVVEFVVNIQVQVAVDLGERATLDVYARCRLRSIRLAGFRSQQY